MACGAAECVDTGVECWCADVAGTGTSPAVGPEADDGYMVSVMDVSEANEPDDISDISTLRWFRSAVRLAQLSDATATAAVEKGATSSLRVTALAPGSIPVGCMALGAAGGHGAPAWSTLCMMLFTSWDQAAESICQQMFSR